MNMKWGVGYFTTNTVSAFEENRLIAWHHFARFVWCYELVEESGATTVTESFDYSVPWGVLLGPMGIVERNRAAITASLERLAALVAPTSTP